MDEQESAFLRELEGDPLNHPMRMVYSDWLDENDRPEGAERQRQWVPAYDFIKQFTREQEDGGWKYDENDERIPGSLTFTYALVMREIEFWRRCVTNEFTNYGLGGSIGFSTDYAADELQNEETRREFWRCFQVLTGVEAPAELRNQRRYHCAC